MFLADPASTVRKPDLEGEKHRTLSVAHRLRAKGKNGQEAAAMVNSVNEAHAALTVCLLTISRASKEAADTSSASGVAAAKVSTCDACPGPHADLCDSPASCPKAISC